MIIIGGTGERGWFWFPALLRTHVAGSGALVVPWNGVCAGRATCVAVRRDRVDPMWGSERFKFSEIRHFHFLSFREICSAMI
jgi:hypothetical protein